VSVAIAAVMGTTIWRYEAARATGAVAIAAPGKERDGDLLPASFRQQSLMDKYQPVPSAAIPGQFKAAGASSASNWPRSGERWAHCWRRTGGPAPGNLGCARRRGWRTAADWHRDVAAACRARLRGNK